MSVRVTVLGCGTATGVPVVDDNNPKFPLPDGVELAYDGLQFGIA